MTERDRTLPANRLRDEGGIALVIAVFALVVLAAVVAGGYFSASQEFQIGRGMKAITSSFYAGEAGIERVVRDWDPAVYNYMAPGDTQLVGPLQLPGGGTYTARVIRVGALQDSLKRPFLIEAAGRPPSPTRGERRQAAVVRTRFYDLCCDAAAKVLVTDAGDPVLVEKNSTISGLDTVPDWGAACAGFPRDSASGLLTRDQSRLSIDADSEILGDPQNIVENTAMGNEIFSFDDINYDSIAAWADFVVPGGTTFSNVGPKLVDGECDRSDPQNWGAPEDPSSPCFDYFPVIYAQGALKIRGNFSGQAIVLTDDDLDIAGPFDFYGIALVRDDLLMGANVRFIGAAVVTEGLQLTGNNGRLQLSRCVATRAARFSSLARGHLLEQRAWVELF